uniref:Uncharacterized protein n=1 Tax=Daucus carota subsp. sativus TaxID=79200 RepID=A0A166ECY2_DAUCS
MLSLIKIRGEDVKPLSQLSTLHHCRVRYHVKEHHRVLIRIYACQSHLLLQKAHLNGHRFAYKVRMTKQHCNFMQLVGKTKPNIYPDPRAPSENGSN